MSELTEAEWSAMALWRNLGKENMDLALRVLAMRHREEYDRIFEELEEQ